MGSQWRSCRSTISFPVVMNLRCFFFKELFENIDAETETGESPSKDSEPKADAAEPQTEPSRKRRSIVIIDDEEIEDN